MPLDHGSDQRQYRRILSPILNIIIKKTNDTLKVQRKNLKTFQVLAQFLHKYLSGNQWDTLRYWNKLRPNSSQNSFIISPAEPWTNISCNFKIREKRKKWVQINIQTFKQ